MRTIHDLKSSLPQTGKVQWIGLRSSRRSDIDVVLEVEVSEESGLEGDHNSKKGGKRMVTLIQEEHLDTMSSLLSKKVIPGLLRRNIVVKGINLNALHDAQFKIGDEVILEGTGYCHPCSRMEDNLGAGGYNAMRGHGGITAKVISGGKIKLDDKVTFISVE